MARDRNRRTIYDNDGTTITETTDMVDTVEVTQTNNISPVVNRRSATRTRNITMSVDDVLDTFASYLAPRFKITKDTSTSGNCMICNKETAYPMRKLCVECLEKHSDTIYTDTKNAVQNGENAIIVKTNV